MNGGGLTEGRTLVASLGADGVTSESTISCQINGGRQMSLGLTRAGEWKGKPHHTGPIAELSKDQIKKVKTMAGM